MLHIARFWDARQQAPIVIPPVPTPVPSSGGGGWSGWHYEPPRKKRTKEETEETLRQLVAEATEDAPPEVVAEVIAVVGAKPRKKQRAAAQVAQINWPEVMARTSAQLDRLEARLVEILREREQDEEDVILLMLGS